MEPPNDEEVIPQLEHPAAVDEDLLGVRHCLSVCGFNTPLQQDTIIDKGFTAVRSFAELRDKDVYEMVKSINAPPAVARGRRPADPPPVVRITRRAARRLEGLVFWVKDKIKRGIEIDLYTFDENSLLESLQEIEGEDKADTVDVESPIKFTTDKWIQWEKEFTNYLSAKRGTRGVPLSYIIRPELAPNEIISKDDVTKQEIYAAPLEGAPYRRDNRTVWGLLRSFTIATPAWEWIKQRDTRGDGHQGMQLLRSHYDGPD
jgi:hypothetical protein